MLGYSDNGCPDKSNSIVFHIRTWNFSTINVEIFSKASVRIRIFLGACRNLVLLDDVWGERSCSSTYRRLRSRTPTAAVTTCSTRFVHTLRPTRSYACVRVRVCASRLRDSRRSARSLARVTPAPFSHEIALPPSHHSFLGRPRPPLAPFALWQASSRPGAAELTRPCRHTDFLLL